MVPGKPDFLSFVVVTLPADGMFMLVEERDSLETVEAVSCPYGVPDLVLPGIS